MFKKIIGATLIGLVASHGFAFEVECPTEQDRIKAAKHGYTCSSNTPITLKRQQKQCEIELEKACRGKIAVTPVEDSGCAVGKLSNGKPSYAAYHNIRLKVVTVIDFKSCTSEQIYAAGKLSKTEVFDNKLFILVNGKPMFVDSNDAKLKELLSQSSNSYFDSNNGAAITDMETDISGKTLNLSRRYNKTSDKTQTIKIDDKALTKDSRFKDVFPSDYVKAYVNEIQDYANVIR